MYADLKAKFTTAGFVAPIRVLTPEETVFYRGKYDDYVRRYGSSGQDGGPRRIRGNRLFRLHVVASWAARLVRHPALIKAVAEVLGSDSLLVWSSDLTVKPACSTECFGWHQDEAYADLGPHHQLATAWIALSDSKEENGCVRLIPGSNNQGTLPHTSVLRTPEKNLVLGQILADSSWIKDWERKSVNCVLAPGEASLHAWRTVHSSLPNTSNQDRIGLAVRYMSCAVRTGRPVVKERVSLVSGVYDGDWFELEAEPSGDYGKAEWAEHKLSMEREWERRRRSKELGLLPSQMLGVKGGSNRDMSQCLASQELRQVICSEETLRQEALQESKSQDTKMDHILQEGDRA